MFCNQDCFVRFYSVKEINDQIHKTDEIKMA